LIHPGKCRADCPRVARAATTQRSKRRARCPSPAKLARAGVFAPERTTVHEVADRPERRRRPRGGPSKSRAQEFTSCPTPLLRYTAARARCLQRVAVDPRDALRAPASMTKAVRTAQSPWWQGRRKRPHSDSEQLHWAPRVHERHAQRQTAATWDSLNASDPA